MRLMFIVQYRCIYREHWYDDSEWWNWQEAAARAMQLAAAGRTVRILGPGGEILASITP